MASLITLSKTFGSALPFIPTRSRLSLSPFSVRPFRTTTASAGNSEDAVKIPSGDHSGKFETTRVVIEKRKRNPFLIEGSEDEREVVVGEDALYISYNLPGIGKQELEISAEKNQMSIVGEENFGKDPALYKDDGMPRRYGAILTFRNHLKMDQVKSRIKNGVLYFVIPKDYFVERGRAHTRFKSAEDGVTD